MLVDIHEVPPEIRMPDLIPSAYTDQEFQEYLHPKRLRLGFFMPGCSFNPHLDIDGIRVPYGEHGLGNTHFDISGFTPEEMDSRDYKDTYGVADSIEQIAAFYADEVNDPYRQYCIGVTPVTKADQPSDGGWRWHKWGSYIGTKTPTTEYLYDEPEIEAVLVFDIFEVRLPKEP